MRTRDWRGEGARRRCWRGMGVSMSVADSVRRPQRRGLRAVGECLSVQRIRMRGPRGVGVVRTGRAVGAGSCPTENIGQTSPFVSVTWCR